MFDSCPLPPSKISTYANVLDMRFINRSVVVQRASKAVVVNKTWQNYDTSPTNCHVQLTPEQKAANKAALASSQRLRVSRPDATNNLHIMKWLTSR